VTDRPVLRIVGGGTPTDEELAALTTVLAALQSRRVAEAATPSRWGRPGSHPGWLASARQSALRRAR
jgi:hypothetical protein